MQRWFSLANPGRSPYRLYALSNVGSLLALATYRNILQKAEAKEIQYVNGVAGGFVREEVLAKR